MKIFQNIKSFQSGKKTLNNKLNSNFFLFKNNSSWDFINPGAKAYYEALKSAGLTTLKILTLYGITKRQFKIALDEFWTESGFNSLTDPLRVWIFIGDNTNTALIECLSASAIGTAVGSPTIGTNGISFNGVSNYIDSSTKASTFCFSVTNSMIGGYNSAWTFSASKTLIGANNSSVSNFKFGTSAAILQQGVFLASASAILGAGSNTKKFVTGGNGANSILITDSGTYSTSLSGSALPSSNFFIGATNNAGSPTQYANTTIGLIFISNKWFDTANLFSAYINFCNKINRST